MNYNDYDSKGNEKSFDYSLLFSEKKYRARLILAAYFVFFVILIIFVRNGNSNSSLDSNSGSENNGSIVDDNEDNVEDDNVDNMKYSEEFSYIMSNNYNFEFILTSDSNVFTAKGKRYNDKYDFLLTDGDAIIDYLSDGNRVNAESDGEYYDTNLPYYYVNYFDNEVLYGILSSATEIDDGIFAISNRKLLKYIDSLYQRDLSDEELINTIVVRKKNGIIVSIELDLTNIINSLGINETNSTKIVLNYSNFNSIDDFEVKF